uniref:Uncharacterized protein n=1 Tax=uncultured bacterium ws138B4 TaxID=1131827 RepID=I1X4N4_9BACT|nr:hypothetical protein ws138B4_0018 [uncultured bacterium ws138B4]
MADLFTITAPLMIRYPDDTKHVMVHCFPHPDGLVYFRTFWDQLPETEGVRLLTGELRGEGPWKVGDAVITLLGCQGTHPRQAAEYADWQLHLEQTGPGYPSRSQLQDKARVLHNDAGADLVRDDLA